MKIHPKTQKINCTVLKKNYRESMPPNPLRNAHGFDMQISKFKKQFLASLPPPKSWGRPCFPSL